MSTGPQPDLLGLVSMAANSFWSNKQLLPARKAFELALSLDPENLEALNKLGRIALATRKPEEALRWFGRAWAIDLHAPATAINLAAACARLKQFDAALQWCQEVLDRDPNFQPAWIHKIGVLEEMGDSDAAYASALRALQLLPGNPELLFALAQHQLIRGDYENGWRNYEHRAPRLDLAAKLDEYPEWVAGDRWPVAGETILVSGEQGLGDKILFARYLPLLVELGFKVVLFTSVELARLFAACLPGVRIVTSDRELDAVEKEIDCWVAMGSLPFRLRTAARRLRTAAFCQEVETVWTPVPYLKPLPPGIDRFAALIPRDGTLRVGLCWRGNPEHRRDEYRSISWEQMRPLTEVPGCTFYSLQYGDTESGLLNLTRYTHDMADTAAAMANIDLVISVDTAVLHLAGAMGVPVWGLLGSPADWRWGRDAEETPWYSSAVLIHSRGDWNAAIQFAAAKLGALRTRYRPPATERSEQPATDPVVTRQCRYGPMSWYRNDTYIGRALDLYGEYSQAEVELFKRILKPGDVVVEAGANIGALTVALANIVAPQGDVHAFEPQPRYAELARRNTEHFGARVQVYDVALGAEETSLTLRHVPLDAIHAPGWPSTGEEFTVRQTTIDACEFRRVSLIKVDVDGAELAILNGAERTIARCRPFLYVENDKPDKYPDLLPWMISHGYRLYQHMAPLFNPNNFAGNRVNVFGSTVSAMVLGVPDERKDLHFPDLTRLRLG